MKLIRTERDNYNNWTLTIGPALIMALLVFVPLSSGVIQQFFLLAIIAGYFAIIIRNLGSAFRRGRIMTFIPALLWLAWNLLVGVYYGSGITRLIQNIAVLVIVLGTSMFSKKDITDSMDLIKYITLLYVTSWIMWIPFATKNGEYSAYFSNSNILGSMAFNIVIICYFTSFRRAHNRYIILFIASCFIIASGSRTSLLAFLIFLLVSKLLDIKQDEKLKWLNSSVLFLIGIACSLVISYVYPTLYGTSIGIRLNILSQQLFNKNFFSGRQILWSAVIEEINQAPLLGHGLQAIPSDYINTTLSAHNLYLQTLLQTGWIGLALLIWTLWTFYLYCSRVNTKISTITMAVIIAVIFRECFEVTLTQNNWPQGFFIWVIIGLSYKEKEYVDIP